MERNAIVLSRICCGIKNYFDGANRVRLWFFEYTYWNTQTKCYESRVLWGHSLFLTKPKLYSTFHTQSSKAKGGRWLKLAPISRNKVPREIGPSQMPTFTESCPSVNFQFPNARCQFLIGPFFLFLFLSFFGHIRKPTRVGFRVWWALQLLRLCFMFLKLLICLETSVLVMLRFWYGGTKKFCKWINKHMGQHFSG
jgi:hypothetical protein